MSGYDWISLTTDYGCSDGFVAACHGAIARIAPAVPPTCHGRDVFAPVAARLALGADLGDAGAPVDPATLVRLPDPVVVVGDGWLEAEVTTVDRFGNVQLAAGGDTLDRLG